MSLFRLAFAIACAFTAINVAHADDWTADKLRGQVLQLIDNQWQPLTRGMVVPDSRVIRTLGSGRVTFTRGNETVDIGPNTQIQIYDKGGRKPFTTVKQYFGTVSVEAEVQQVQHFAVQTPYLAAVVKGTRFTVTSGKTDASVLVRRGHVEVDDRANKTHVTIAVGQSASVDTAAGGQLEVAGKGRLPAVLDARGKPVDPSDAVLDLKSAAKLAEEQAKLLKTPDAKAAAEAAKKAAQAAEKEAKDAAKDADKEAKDAQKDADKAAKDAAKSDGGGNSGPGSNSSGPDGGGSGSDKGKGKKDH